MPEINNIEKYIDLITRAWPIIVTFFLFSSRIRNMIGRWLANALTREVRDDMNQGFNTINETLSETKTALVKSEKLQTRRHNSNQREIRSNKEETIKIGEEMKKRMDDHLIDHGKETNAPTNIP